MRFFKAGKSKIKLEFDQKSFNVHKVRYKVWGTLRPLLFFLLATMSLTVVLYVAVALVFSTRTEKRLRRENRDYARNWHKLRPKELELQDALTVIQHKDNDIYTMVFHSDAPNVDPMSSLDYFFSSDTVPDTKLVSYTRDKSDLLMEQARRVDDAFVRIARQLERKDRCLPPMTLPLDGISYPQMGASTGRKINPFYRTYVFHTGADFLVPRGSPVYASADAEVSAVNSTKSFGIAVRLMHAGGYETMYAHLEKALVKAGQTVRKGDQIGVVGMTGNAFAPHLHYEVLKDGVPEDPVSHLFASLSPDEYANILYMAVNTMQSMD